MPKQKKETPPHPTPSGVVSSLAKVAEAFGVRLDTIKKEWRKRDMPGRPGAWDLAAIAEWKALRDRDPDADGDEEARRLRRRKLELENAIKELEKAKRARQEQEAGGDLVSRRDVEAVVAQALQRIRRGLSTIPRLLQPRLPKDLQATLPAELGRLIDQVLLGLVEELQQAAHQAAAKAEDDVDEEAPEPRPIKRNRRKKATQAQADPAAN